MQISDPCAQKNQSRMVKVRPQESSHLSYIGKHGLDLRKGIKIFCKVPLKSNPVLIVVWQVFVASSGVFRQIIIKVPFFISSAEFVDRRDGNRHLAPLQNRFFILCIVNSFIQRARQDFKSFAHFRCLLCKVSSKRSICFFRELHSAM